MFSTFSILYWLFLSTRTISVDIYASNKLLNVYNTGLSHIGAFDVIGPIAVPIYRLQVIVSL